MPSEASTVSGDQLVEQLKRELAEARAQEAATSEILRVISSSPTDLERVFADVAARAARLCDAYDARIHEVVGDRLRLVAHHGPLATVGPIGQVSLPLLRGVVVGRAVLDRQTIHVADLQAETDEFPEGSAYAQRLGHHTTLAVPLISVGEAIGAISARRTEVRQFTDRQVELLKTFADQAVIAIENTRLFEAEQASKRELRESLEYQVAMSDVLNVISRSPTELQPVLDTIATTAARLCESVDAVVFRIDGEQLRLAAQQGSFPRVAGGLPLTRGTVTGRAVIDRRTIHVPDIATELDNEYPDARVAHQVVGHRTTLAAPLLRNGEPLGAILLRRVEVRPFSPKQITLLQTFADQAVIAIENTRLFEAEQASKRELQESLEYQTAISSILDIISRSKGEIQRVFDAIVQSAARLFCPCTATIITLKDGHLHWNGSASLQPGFDPQRMRDRMQQVYPAPFDPERVPSARAILERRTLVIPDARTPDTPEYTRKVQKVGDFRSVAFVPLVNEDKGIGTIVLTHPQAGFELTEKQLELLQTFADQAVIAIENTRLFEEVQARTRDLTDSLEYQTATSDVLNVISRSKFDLQPVLDTIADSAARLCGGLMGGVLRFDGSHMHVGAMVNFAPEGEDTWRKLHPRPPTMDTAAGRAVLRREVVVVVDAEAERRPDWARDIARAGGYRSAVAVPMLREGIPIGAIVVARKEPGQYPQPHIELLKTFADQAVVAIENTRLFDEIAAKSRELEIASQHKSQFVANMSHELRTPLAAILGYAELMQEGFYEPLGQKSLDALTRIRSNGKHLLGLINTVLDIAKIEAGQFNLNLAEYALSNVVEAVRAATESLAETKKLALKTEVAKSLPIGFGDEQRLTQVLLNLVGNAIKFTDNGEVRITATTENGHFAVSVVDTGPGIPADQLTRVFEQFHQVDNSNTKKKGGTGLGLAIAKQIVEMHGGRVWVESEPGHGATFLMQLPVRATWRAHQ